MNLKEKIFVEFKILDKVPVLIIFVFLALILLLMFQHGPYVFGQDSIPIESQELKCIGKLSNGVLYQFDLECHQGPVFYMTLYGLQKYFPHTFYFSVVFFSLFLFTILFLFLYKILKKEVEGYYFLAFVMYIAFIFLYSFSDFDLSDLFALFWFFIGFYLLFYSNLKFKRTLSGSLFAFSFLTKQTYIIPIGIVLLFYFIKTLRLKIKDKKFHYNIEGVYNIGTVLVFFGFLLTLFHLIFPNFLSYSFNLGNPTLQLEGISRNATLFFDGLFIAFSKIFNVLKFQKQLVLLLSIAVFILSFYYVTKKRDLIGPFTLTSILLAFTINSFILGDNVVEYKRILFIIPLFIILYIKLMKESENNLIGRLLLILILLILIYPAFKVVYLNHQMSELEEEVGYVLHDLPQQHTILSDRDRLRFYDYKLDYTMELINRDTFTYDLYAAHALEKAGLINASAWKTEELKKESYLLFGITKNISERRYDAIMYLPQGDGYEIKKLIAYINRLSQENNIPFKQLFSMECQVYIPTLEERCVNCDHKIIMYFLNASHCEDMKDTMVNYYKAHLDNICKKDKYAGDYILSALTYNGITFEECNGPKGNLLEHYSNKYKITKSDFIFLFIVFILVITFYLLKKEKRNSFYLQLKENYKNNKRFLFAVFIFILIISTLYAFSKIFIICEKPYIKNLERGECCLDLDNDYACDGQKGSLNECLIKAGDKYITLGRVCDYTEDCIIKAKQMGIPEVYLNSDLIECRPTYFKTMTELIQCNTKQDCLNIITNQTDLGEVIDCGNNGFCQMTIYSMLSLKNFYSV